jgi:hypothetical protein
MPIVVQLANLATSLVMKVKDEVLFHASGLSVSGTGIVLNAAQETAAMDSGNHRMLTKQAALLTMKTLEPRLKLAALLRQSSAQAILDRLPKAILNLLSPPVVPPLVRVRLRNSAHVRASICVRACVVHRRARARRPQARDQRTEGAADAPREGEPSADGAKPPFKPVLIKLDENETWEPSYAPSVCVCLHTRDRRRHHAHRRP